MVVHSCSESSNKHLEFYCVGDRGAQAASHSEERGKLLSTRGMGGNGRPSRHSTGTQLTDSPPPVSCGPHPYRSYAYKQHTSSIPSEHAQETNGSGVLECSDGRGVQKSRRCPGRTEPLDTEEPRHSLGQEWQCLRMGDEKDSTWLRPGWLQSQDGVKEERWVTELERQDSSSALVLMIWVAWSR